ncbi:MAG TPA: amidohydrolase family protein [Longilinea sp.]|nr:amidohydrolase family protein [Longilinea sp.]
MSETIILPEWLIISAREAPKKHWGVLVRDEKIIEVAPNKSLLERYPHVERTQADSQVLSPGFVNTHTHLYGVLAHGIPLHSAPDGFWPFLKDFWWPKVENRLDTEMICAAAEWQCQLMLRSGVTSFFDCLEAPNALPGCLQAEAAVVRQYGQRAILSFEATQRLSLENGELGQQENTAFFDDCKKKGRLISGMLCYHTTFSCSEDFIQQSFALAAERQAQVHAHCCESIYEPIHAVKEFGIRPLEYYQQMGVAGKNMLLSQCVQLDSSDIEIIATSGIHVSHMPLSNCEVGGGIAPIPAMANAGVTIGLGSDSYIDDFFEVMRGAFLIHKANLCDPRVMPANLVWHMATEGGAQVLNLEKVGQITPGWQADLQLIDADFPTPAEDWNLYDQLVLYRNASHVRMVMTAGKTLVKDGNLTFGNSIEARQNVSEQAQRLWNSAS